MTTQATQELSFEDAETVNAAVLGKFVSIGDGSDAKRNSKTDYRTTVVARLTGIRKDENYSTDDKVRRFYDMITDQGEAITVTDNAALKGITSDLIGNVLRIVYLGKSEKAKPGQSAAKQIEIKSKAWTSLSDAEKARFVVAEPGDANEQGL